MARGRAGLADLKRLRRELEESQRAAAQAQAEAQARAQAAYDAAREFEVAMRGVTPLPVPDRVWHEPEAPEPLPLQRWADDAEVLRASLSDVYEADWLIDTDDTLSYRRLTLSADVVRRLRRGEWSVKAQLDLHGHRVEEARDALADFLRECVKREWRCVRVIHGKGLGSRGRQPVLKDKVRRWLRQKEEVLAFVEARPTDGGSGVLIVLLKSASKAPS